MGTVRFTLAMAVVVYHLTQQVHAIGQFAVYGFYVISGYLMTMVLREVYDFDPKRFWTNRVIRLFPGYFALAAFALAIFAVWPDFRTFHPSWSEPAGNGSIVGNLLMFPWAALPDSVVPVLPWQAEGLYFRVLPSTWSVGVELVCYGLIWLFGARSLAGAAVLTVLGAAWHVVCWYVDAPVTLRYFPVPAAALAFGIGSLAYFVSVRVTAPKVPLWIVVIASLAALWGNWMWSLTYSLEALKTPHFYGNLLICAALVVFANTRRFAGLAGRFDRLLGDIAYPMFLGHYVFAFVGWHMLGTATPNRGWDIFWLGSAVCILGSIVVVYVIDRPLEKLRARIRTEQPQEPKAAPQIPAL